MFCHLLITFSTGCATLHLTEDLKDAHEDQLRHRLEDALAAGCQTLEVDCHSVRRIGSVSLAALATAKEALESRGGSLTITRTSPAFMSAARKEGFGELVPEPAPVVALGPSGVPAGRASGAHRTSHGAGGVRR